MSRGSRPATFVLLLSRAAALRTHSWPLPSAGGARPYRASVFSAASDDELPALPDRVDAQAEDQSRTIDVNGVPLTLDELGPIVIQENGKMGRLSNWHEMTEQVRQVCACGSWRGCSCCTPSACALSLAPLTVDALPPTCATGAATNHQICGEAQCKTTTGTPAQPELTTGQR
eukprot:3211836-Prymnesium_polylepis.1